MSPKQSKPILEKIGIKKPEQMVSVLAFSLGKSGFFRANINGSRVNCSCRTVITPSPYLLCNQVACPKVIAEQITVPIRVNSENIAYLRSLINNYPNYPCALCINDTQRINEKSKQYIIDQLIPGDIVNRQVIDGDICLSNRYPSVREESFGGLKVKISNQQSIQFNLSVVEKFNADFDGDEMQLFFMPSPKDNIEIALLSSAYAQFIQYTSEDNVVGGAKDLKAGIYHLQQLDKEKSANNKFLDKYTNGKANKELEKPFKPIKFYDDGDVVVQNGKLEKFDKSIADGGSKFLTWLYFHYGPAICIQIIDNTLKNCYKINEALNYSLYYDIFNTYSPEQEKFEKERIRKADELLQKYYSGQFKSPMGVDRKKFFTSYLEALLSINQNVQNQTLLEQYTGSGYIKLYNKDIKPEVWHDALISLGFRDDDENHMFETVPRLFCCYPKFSTKITESGYSTDNYINGVNQTTQFLIAYQGRHQAYVRGNVIRDTGYMQRRIQKAFDQVRAGFNQIIFGNNNSIITLQLGQYSFDPRLYQKQEVEWRDSFTVDQKALYKQLIQLQLKCNKQYFNMSDTVLTFGIPFQPTQTEITQQELDALLSCRLTENMAPALQQVTYLQSFYFWAYCYLTMEIVKKTPDWQIVKDYIRSLLSPGDSIGIKSAMAITGPVSQDTLDAIHHVKTKSGKIQYVNEDKTVGSFRFLELTQCQTQHIQFTAQLLNKTDENLASRFVQKYQTLLMKTLKPQIDIYFSNKSWNFDITIDFNQLAYNNVDLQEMVDQLIDYFETKKVTLSESKDLITLSFQFPSNVSSTLLANYRTHLLNDFKFGSIFLYNVYYTQQGDEFFIKGNILQGHDKDIYFIKELDIDTIQNNNILFFNEYFGINKTELQLYNEYSKNIESIQVTRGTNKAFYMLFASFQTQTGNYEGFQRFSYKRDVNRDFIQNIIYEEGTAFIQNEVQNPKWNQTQSFQNTQVFGTQGNAGTDISQYFI